MSTKPGAIQTGLSASGKSTIASSLVSALAEQGRLVTVLDGDNLRNGLCKDLGFYTYDREENIRRISEVSALLVSSGITVIVAVISPSRSGRELARTVIGTDRFMEVFVDAPLSVAEGRDPKGLYKRARRGEIKQFTGIDSVYEAPLKPELHLCTDKLSVEECVQEIVLSLDLASTAMEPDAHCAQMDLPGRQPL